MLNLIEERPVTIAGAELERPRLLRRLDAVAQARLACVVAPAGAGKTTLLQQWAAQYPCPVAWMIPDESDNDRVIFLVHLLAALRSAWPELATTALGVPSAMLTVDAAAMSLLNALAACEGDCVVILDRYEVLHSEEIQRLLALLIEYQPPTIHWIIAGRTEPAWPVLPRLRVRRQLVELNAADLRFDLQETADWASRVWGLALGRAELETLAARTEGWITGMQLLGADPERPGPIPELIEYLAQEVFLPQPEAVRAFLLQTAGLERLNGPLCDAVTENSEGWKMLDRLERAQLFTSALDETQHWYRYHPLFAEFLRRERERLSGERCAPASEFGVTPVPEYT